MSISLLIKQKWAPQVVKEIYSDLKTFVQWELAVILDNQHAEKLYKILHKKYPERIINPFKPRLTTLEKTGNKLYHWIPAYICGILAYLQSKRWENDTISEEEKEFKEWILSKIDPFGYDIGPKIVQLWSDTIRNTKETAESQPLKTKIRVDFFRVYLWLEQRFDTLNISTTKPTKTKNQDTLYYDFNPTIKNEAIEHIKDTCKTFKDLKSYINKHHIFPWSDKENRVGPQLHHYNPVFLQLGNYKAHIGEGINPQTQKKETYISYRDIRDLDPIQNSNLDIDMYNHPFEIYGRIYQSDFEK